MKMRHFLSVTLFLLSTSSCFSVFIGREKAHHVLQKRANNFLEEILPGNLERECYEETCSKEEAREIFKSQEKTTEFWFHYKDLSPCKENPCINGGICQQYHYTYTCLCPPRYTGRHCENVRYECWYNNGGCWQYCTDTARSLSVKCSCARGYTLEEDGKKCVISDRFPCGLMSSSSRSLLDPDLESLEHPTSDTIGTENSHPNTTAMMPTPRHLNDSIDMLLTNETACNPNTTAMMPTPRRLNDSIDMLLTNETACNPNTTAMMPMPRRLNDSIEMPPTNETACPQAMDKPVDNGTSQDLTGTARFISPNESGSVNKTLYGSTNKTDNKDSTAGGESVDQSTLNEDSIGHVLGVEDGTRIVGGMRCELGQCPWQVLIRNSRGIDFCGGSLISQRWVMSAAHCFEGIDPHHVTIGDYDKYLRDKDEQKIAVLEVFSHPYYLAEHYDNDIALVYLRSPAIFSEYTRPICLPSPSLGQLLTQEGEVGLVSGWGATRHLGRFTRFLLKVRLPVVSQETCMASTNMVLTGNMFCAGYAMEAKDACNGDSGGPFAVLYRNTWYLIGVVSWGEGCADDGKYGVYTRVANYISWIKETIIDTEGFDESLVQTL
ncbi:coagulation factor X-like [Pseudophryne corroboree]|uniref:coagulation factor X-like n=1 Tax=Pseudophryne corroboree TaxID=495146 RepID=UPI0030821FAF